MARTRNQSDNASPRRTVSSSSIPDVAHEDMPDLPRILTEEQQREVTPDPVMVSTIRRMFEEHQNDLTTHMVNHLTDVIKPLISNMISELAPKQTTTGQIPQPVDQINQLNPQIGQNIGGNTNAGYVPSVLNPIFTQENRLPINGNQVIGIRLLTRNDGTNSLNPANIASSSAMNSDATGQGNTAANGGVILPDQSQPNQVIGNVRQNPLFNLNDMGRVMGNASTAPVVNQNVIGPTNMGNDQALNNLPRAVVGPVHPVIPDVVQDQRMLEQAVTAIMQRIGHNGAIVPRPIYRKPYPDWVDNVQYPRGFKIPEFSLFTGEDDQSTVEHISKFTAQCGEVSNDGNLKLRLFPLSLSKTSLLGTQVYQ